MFGMFTHGDERKREITVDNGNETYYRTEKYCIEHGWVDLFRIGGAEAWHSQHDRCNKTAHTGAFVEIPKVMRATA